MDFCAYSSLVLVVDNAVTLLNWFFRDFRGFREFRDFRGLDLTLFSTHHSLAFVLRNLPRFQEVRIS